MSEFTRDSHEYELVYCSGCSKYKDKNLMEEVKVGVYDTKHTHKWLGKYKLRTIPLCKSCREGAYDENPKEDN